MESAGVARPLPGLQLLFAASSALVALAGVQLFIFSERTDDFFAWTIASPLTAAVDGAFFLASLVLFVSAARAVTWAEVRPVAGAVVVVATVKLAATLLDLEPFHFEGPGTAAQVAAWSWLAVYIVVPAALVGLIAAQLRAPGADPQPGPPLPHPLAGAFIVLAMVMFAIGGVQLFASGVAADIWPWPLTTLTSHTLSAWFLGVGVLAALMVRENDLARSRWVMLGAMLLGVLLAVALARYESAIQWERAVAWLFVGLIVTLVFAGGCGLLAGRRSDQQSSVASTSL
jgi:hypothetical protein